MDPLDYLKLLRRRWWLLGGTLALAVGATWATLPTQSADGRALLATSYTATHVLLQAPDAVTPINFPLTVLFATVGEVPQRVAVRLGQPETEGPALAREITVTSDEDVAAMRITATGRDADRTALLANTFAAEITEFLRNRAQEDRDTEAAALQSQISRLSAEVSRLTDRIDAAGGAGAAPLLQAQRDAYTSRYQSSFDRFTALQEQGAVRSDLITLQEAVPVGIAPQGSPVLTSPAGRLGLAALLGLLLGVGIVLGLDRLDTRLRSREQVEEASRLPVVAEIPQLDRAQRRASEIVTVVDPGGAPAEAYRALRSSLLLVPSRPVQLGEAVETVVPADWQPPRVVLVTSAAPSDGKTSTVVNLAATLAESGRSVIVLDADFRKPAANRYLGVPRSAGLSELLAHQVAGGLPDVLHDTVVPGVRMVTSGTASRHPAMLLARMGDIVQAAAARADVVIVDSAPLLVANDATDIVPHVDTVLVVVQAAKTTAVQAERTAELLARLGVPVLGAVLQASGEASGVGSYYGGRRRGGYGYATRPEDLEPRAPRPGRRGRRAAADLQPGTPGAEDLRAEAVAPVGRDGSRRTSQET